MKKVVKSEAKKNRKKCGHKYWSKVAIPWWFCPKFGYL